MGEQGQWDLAKKGRKATNTKRMSPIPGEYFRQHKQKKITQRITIWRQLTMRGRINMHHERLDNITYWCCGSWTTNKAHCNVVVDG
jgi:hypothetical protein